MNDTGMGAGGRGGRAWRASASGSGQMTRRRFVAGAAALGMGAAMTSLLAAGCSRVDAVDRQRDAAGRPEDSHRGGTLAVRALASATLDPARATGPSELQMVGCLFAPLTRYDHRSYALQGLACQTWEADDQNLKFTFWLVQGATFHSYEPVIADSFKSAWQRVLRIGASGGASKLGLQYLMGIQGAAEYAAGEADDLVGVECPDDYTLKVTLTAAQADFPYQMANLALSPVPSDASDDTSFGLAPVGNGPFSMTEAWDGGDTVQLSRFDDYGYGDPAHLDGVDFISIADDGEAWERFGAGEVDFTRIPVANMDEAVGSYGESSDGTTVSPDGQILTGDEERVVFLAFNLADALGGNESLRRALAYSLDQQALVDDTLESLATPATGMLPLGVSAYDEDDWGTLVQDCDIASQLLVSAGLIAAPVWNPDADDAAGDEDVPAASGASGASGADDGTDGEAASEAASDAETSADVAAPDADAEPVEPCPLAIMYRESAGETATAYLEALAAQAAQVGIAVTLEPVGDDAYASRLTSGDYVACLASWQCDAPLAEHVLYPLFSSGSALNHLGFSSGNIDRSLASARATADAGSRNLAYREIHRAVGASMPVVPLFFAKHHHIGSQRTNSLYLSPEGLLDLTGTWLTR